MSEPAKASVADATHCVHAGEERHGTNASLTTDIAQTSVFVMPSLDELRRYAEGKSKAYMYSRYANPTTTVAEQKIAALEGAEACVVTASGMAAELAIFMALCESGDEIVSMLDLYGGTTKLFQSVLPRFGIRTRLVPFTELDEIERYFSERTRLLFLETPTNPTLRCADIRKLAAIGQRHNAVVVVDNTFATPILQKPLALGADITIHSATKYLGGHNDLTAGAVAGSRQRLDTIREMVKFTGGCLDPLGSFLLIRGLKTLEIRVERACANARLIAEALRKHEQVGRVLYPGFADDPGHDIARRQMGDFGMMVSFETRGGGPAAEKFIDSLQLWYLATSLGGVESTVSYPLLSSHVGLTDEQLKLLDVSAATVRLSVGIEHPADLVADIEQALDRA
ncbi:MAG: aminotransferase class I/II-fold pyridoxal phosphate-dependent enzyme [Acidobacteriia bacterium]|nr:aminotransferase class I/II-fold pyridoxal phosphate-dependent enzyme [Terriglobia bacterium]